MEEKKEQSSPYLKAIGITPKTPSEDKENKKDEPTNNTSNSATTSFPHIKNWAQETEDTAIANNPFRASGGSDHKFGFGGFAPTTPAAANKERQEPPKLTVGALMDHQQSLERKFNELNIAQNKIAQGQESTLERLTTIEDSLNNQTKRIEELNAKFSNLNVDFKTMDSNATNYFEIGQQRFAALDGAIMGVKDAVNNIPPCEAHLFDMSVREYIKDKARSNAPEVQALQQMVKDIHQKMDNDKNEDKHLSTQATPFMERRKSDDSSSCKSERSISRHSSWGRPSKRSSPYKDDDTNSKKSRTSTRDPSLDRSDTLFQDKQEENTNSENKTSNTFAKPHLHTASDDKYKPRTVYDNLCLFCKAAGLPADISKHRAVECITVSSAKLRYDTLKSQRRCYRCCIKVDVGNYTENPHDSDRCKMMTCRHCQQRAGECGGTLCTNKFVRWDMEKRDVKPVEPF